MKRDEVIRLISETQDSNVLIKGFEEDDLLSKLIMEAIKNHVDENDNVDLEGLRDELDYIGKQTMNAKMTARQLFNSFLEEKEKEMKDFEIDVCRTGYGFATIKVRATSQEEAEVLALEEAGSHEFREKDADYKIV